MTITKSVVLSVTHAIFDLKLLPNLTFHHLLNSNFLNVYRLTNTKKIHDLDISKLSVKHYVDYELLSSDNICILLIK